MSEAVRTGDTRVIAHHSIHTPSRLLVGGLAASLALHALFFLLLPEWNRNSEIQPVTVLDVVMQSREPEVAKASPSSLPQETPEQAAIQRPQQTRQHVQTQPQTPERMSLKMDAPVKMTEPEPAAKPADTASIIEPLRPAIELKSAVPSVIPVTPPVFSAAYLRNPPPRYPPSSRRNGDEGTVMLKVLVGPDGAPLQVEVDRSSGSSPLDNAALEAVRGWRFVPARRGAQNIEAWVKVPVVFRLQSG